MTFKPLRPMAGSAVLVLLLGGLSTGTMAQTAPTFSGYHWPAGTELAYQVALKTTIHAHVTKPSDLQTTVTITWHPTVALSTGTAIANGTPVTLSFSKTPMVLHTTLPGGGKQTDSIALGALSMTGILRSNGRLAKIHLSMSKKVLPAGMNLSSVLPINGANFLPPVPRVGWTAGRGFLFSETPGTSPLMSLGALGGSSSTTAGSLKVVLSSTAKLGEWIVPQVGHHHWSVQTQENMVHPLVATLTAPVGTTKLQLKESITGAFTSHYTLNGQKGGLLTGEQAGGHLTISQSGTLPKGANGSPTSYQSTSSVAIHFSMQPSA